LERRANRKAIRYIMFSISFLPRPTQVQITSSAPYSRTHLASVPLQMWQTTFHTHTQ